MIYTLLPASNFLEIVQPVFEDALAECERVLPSYREMRVIVQYTEDQFVVEKMGGSVGSTHDGEQMTIQVNTDTSTWKGENGVRYLL